MKNISPQSTRLYLTLLVSVCVCALLLWQHFHGGVPRHHLLQRADLPSISNWWGALLLPLITWFMVGRINKRAAESGPRWAIIGFLAAVLFGIVFSASFLNNIEPVLLSMMLSLLVLALFFPIYRAEYFVGFVLATFYTFGAVIPIAFGLIFGLTSAIIFHCIRPIPKHLIKMLRSGK